MRLKSNPNFTHDHFITHYVLLVFELLLHVVSYCFLLFCFVFFWPQRQGKNMMIASGFEDIFWSCITVISYEIKITLNILYLGENLSRKVFSCG